MRVKNIAHTHTQTHTHARTHTHTRTRTHAHKHTVRILVSLKKKQCTVHINTFPTKPDFSFSTQERTF